MPTWACAAIASPPWATWRKRPRARRIDASRLVIAPGFIDMLGQSEYNVLVDNRAASKITQGITTEITGEGSSIAPVSAAMIASDEPSSEHYGVRPDWTTLAGYFPAFEKKRLGHQPGHVRGRRRRARAGRRPRGPRAHCGRARADGEAAVARPWRKAPSASPPRSSTCPALRDTEEIIALAKVARRYGGSYITHQRDEGDGIDASLDEVFRIAREASIPAEISHLKTADGRTSAACPPS